MSSETESGEQPMMQRGSKEYLEQLEQGPMRIKSLCPACHYEGAETRLLLTVIPHFAEVILASTTCPECHYKNQEVQFGGKFGEKGIEIEVEIKNKKDLDRQVVKSDYCSIFFPQVNLTIPKETQRGSLSTVEGILSRTIEGLSAQQPVRKYTNPDAYYQIEESIQKIDDMIAFKDGPFKVIVNDPSGNSHVQNFLAPKPDPQMAYKRYERTREQNREIGAVGMIDDEDEEKVKENMKKNVAKGPHTISLSEKEADHFKHEHVTTDQEINIFPEYCENCGTQGELKMVVCHIPHFKEIILMAFACQHCGFKTNEVKPGGSIPDKGKRITLVVEDEEDLNRDLLKADSCSLHIPEIDLEVTEGSLGGKFTTIEGILGAIKDKVGSMGNFFLGDSAQKGEGRNMKHFLADLDELMTGKKKFTLIVDDPLANSYIQNIYAPDPDPNMKIEEYTRSWEQDEDLGLHDMKTENYQEEEKDGKEDKEKTEEKKEDN